MPPVLGVFFILSVSIILIDFIAKSIQNDSDDFNACAYLFVVK